MGYNSARYIHTLYQAMNLAFADRDFYYGDPYFPPEEPREGPALEGVRQAALRADPLGQERPRRAAGRPLPVPGRDQPVQGAAREVAHRRRTEAGRPSGKYQDAFAADTTSIQAADAEGWVVSVTPSGAWNPAVIAGRTGIGLSQRAQSFVLDEADNPFNVLVPGKRPARDPHPQPGPQGRRSPSSPSPCRARTPRTRTSCSSS